MPKQPPTLPVCSKTGGGGGEANAAEYRAYLETSPAFIHFFAAQEAASLDDQEAALTHFNHAIDLDSADFSFPLAAGCYCLKWALLSQAYDYLAITAKLKPDEAVIHYYLGYIVSQITGQEAASLGNKETALTHYDHAISLDPTDFSFPYIAGCYCIVWRLLLKADDYLTIAAKLKPDDVSTHHNLGWIATQLHHWAAAIPHTERALALASDESQKSENLKALAYLRVLECAKSQKEVNRAVERWVATLGPRKPFLSPISCANLTLEQLRLGIVSGAIGMNVPHHENHVAAFLSQGFKALGIACFVYAIENRQQGTMPAEWRDLRCASSTEIAETIRQDRLHALISLDLIPFISSGELYLEPLAPLVVSCLHAVASQGGLVDALIGDRWLIPPGEDKDFVEKILRLPEFVLLYIPDFNAPSPTPPPCLERGYITFGSLNRPNKINDATIALWSRALCALPETRLYLRSGHFRPGSGEDERILQAFHERGVDGHRIDILSGWTDERDFLTAYGEFDIALDPVGFSGGITTADCLWHGVPVVTLPGTTIPGRMSSAILNGCGFAQWVAQTSDRWLDIVTDLAQRPQDLARYRLALRPAAIASRIFDANRMAELFAQCLLQELRERSSGPVR